MPAGSASRLLGTTGPRATLALIVCWLFVVFDGYDLIVYGNVIGSLQREWGISAATAGTLGSLAFLGMMIGAVIAGRLCDQIGRRRTIIGCAVVLSVFTVACAAAHGPVAFGGLRFIAGIGLGGLVPAVNALAAEVVPDRRRAVVATVMMSGVPVGGSIASIIGIPVIPEWGWRPMFLFALIPLAILIPIAQHYFPDTFRVLPSTRKPGFGGIFVHGYRAASVLFAVTTMATLLAWYGLGTWLPKLMQKSGTDLGNALTFSLALNLGAVAGSFITAWAATRLGPTRTGIASALVAGAALLLLLAGPPVSAVYVIFVLAGVGTHGTQCLVLAAISSFYPERLRGTALGWSLGVGRIGAVAAPQVGGWLIGAGYGNNSNFILFGVSALAAAVLLAVIAFVLDSSATTGGE
ncbi:MAG: aromatic acid/H+ symport family MFS transporter [Gordonia sp. (in: high G+C Gram-positive bacteria)]